MLHNINLMGIYDIIMGKGIIIPVKLFVIQYSKEIEGIFEEGEDEVEFLTKLVEKFIGKEYQVSKIGHDAFDSRDGMKLLECSENEIAYQIIKEWRTQAKKNDDDLPISSLGCSDLMFIGRFKNLEPGDEFGNYIKTPDLLYSLPALLPEIISYSLQLAKMDVSILQSIFGQPPCIWTFADDCHCCG